MRRTPRPHPARRRGSVDREEGMAVTDRFHRPARVPNFNAVEGGEDPAQLLRTARETAHALVNRMRDTDDPEALERLTAFTDDSAVDAVAELWARSSPKSLAGALW